MRMIILVVLVLTASALYFSGDRLASLGMELSNFCQIDADCYLYTDDALAACGRYIHRSEKPKTEKIAAFIKKINPRFRKRDPRNCRRGDPVRSRPICHYGKCIAEEAKWRPPAP